MLLFQVPYLLIYLIGLITSHVAFRKYKKIYVFMIAAFSLLVLNQILYIVLQSWVYASMSSDGIPLFGIPFINSAAMIQLILNIIAWALLLTGILKYRAQVSA